MKTCVVLKVKDGFLYREELDWVTLRRRPAVVSVYEPSRTVQAHSLIKKITIVIVFADWLPLSHYLSAEGIQPWMKDVEAQSGGTITFEFYPAQQLGKATEMLTVMQSGVADVVHLFPAYSSDKFPLSGVGGLSWGIQSSCEGTAAQFTLLQPGGYLAEAEFKPQQAHVLWAVLLDPYVIATATKPIKGADDIKGLKMRSPGGPVDITAANIGAVPISMSAADVLPSLQRGTLDGIFTPILAIKPFDWQTSLKYITTNVSLSAGASVFAIKDSVWEKLDDAQKAALESSGKAIMDRLCTYADTGKEKTVAELVAGGMEELAMDDGGLAMIHEQSEKSRAAWAEGLDKLGKKGTEALGAFERALNEAK